MKNNHLHLLWIIILFITSCITTDKFRVINTETFGPGLLATDSITTIAVLNRDYNAPGTDTFYYRDAVKKKLLMDTVVKFKDLSNTCTDALADYLRNSGYFKAVFNYRDSLNDPLSAQNIAQREKKQNRPKYDASIFLDYMSLRDELMTNSYYFNNQVISSFPEFENSTMMETVDTWLRWGIVYKNDSSKHSYRRIDNLFYGNSVNNNLFGNDDNHRKLLKNAAGSLGESFANELIPHWQKTSRIYYHSNNPQMLVAEKKLVSEDYLGAAEIYRRLTDNKNKNISAKARYNMALICEIQGNMEAAIDWVTRSVSSAKRFDYHHTSRCDEYIKLLIKKQAEIDAQNKLLIQNTAN